MTSLLKRSSSFEAKPTGNVMQNVGGLIVTNKTYVFGCTQIILALIGVNSSAAGADLLHIASNESPIRVYEPFSLSISLAVDAPRGQLERRNERALPVSLAHRRFYAILRDESDAIVSSALLFLEWNTPEDIRARVFGCNGIGFFVVSADTEAPADSGAPLAPGEFSLVLVDRQNSLKSNSISITVLPLNSREKLAADIFVPTYPDGIRLIMKHEGLATTVEAFQVVAQQYPDTYLGQLASLALALERSKSVTKKTVRVHDPSRWEPIADDIAAALKNLGPNDALRAEALFQLALAQSASAKVRDARAVLAQLENTFPYGKWTSLGKQLAEELDVVDAMGNENQ